MVRVRLSSQTEKTLDIRALLALSRISGLLELCKAKFAGLTLSVYLDYAIVACCYVEGRCRGLGCS